MGGDTIENLEELLTRFQLSLEAQDYNSMHQILKKLQKHIKQNPQVASLDLLKALEDFEKELQKKKEEIVAKMSDLQNLKKYRS